MNKVITVYNDDRIPVVTIKVDFTSGSVTVKNGKGNPLVTFEGDSTVIEYAGYHVKVGSDDDAEEM